MNGKIRALATSLLCVLTTWAAGHSLVAVTQHPAAYLSQFAMVATGAAVLGWLLRLARAPRALVWSVQLFVVATGAQHAVSGSWLWSAKHFTQWGSAIGSALDAAQFYAPPIPAAATSFDPLFLLATLATWAVVELSITHLARPSLAAMALVALFVIPQGIVEPASPWWWYASAAGGFLALIVSVETSRGAEWGKRTHHQALGQTAAIATLCIVAALVAAPMLAIGSLTFFGFGDGSGAGEDVVLTNPIADMRRDLRRGEDISLVTVTTAGDPTYLRLSVLSRFSGDTWSAGSREIPESQTAGGVIPLPRGLPASLIGAKSPAQISVDPKFTSQWLPFYAPTTALEVTGDWRYDLDTLDFLSRLNSVSAAGLDYQLESASLRLNPQLLDRSEARGGSLSSTYRGLPSGLPAIVHTQALEVTKDAPTDFDKAVALQDWFRSTAFVYDLNAPVGNGNDTLQSFLAPTGRRGYCEQFASAFAVMARDLGMPSRVVVGFSQPEEVADNTFVFSSHDLHAWPEIYFDGIGWVRFEPTPSARTGSAPGYTTANTNNQPNEPTDEPSVTASPPIRPTGRPSPSTRPTPSSSQPTTAAQTSSVPWGLLATAAAALAAGALVWRGPRAVRLARRRERLRFVGQPGRGWPESAWREISATARDFGTTLPEDKSPRTMASALGRRLGSESSDQLPRHGRGTNPEAHACLTRLTAQLEQARYAPTYAPAEGIGADIGADVLTVCRAIEAGAPARIQRRARWWPRSWWRR